MAELVEPGLARGPRDQEASEAACPHREARGSFQAPEVGLLADHAVCSLLKVSVLHRDRVLILPAAKAYGI